MRVRCGESGEKMRTEKMRYFFFVCSVTTDMSRQICRDSFFFFAPHSDPNIQSECENSSNDKLMRTLFHEEDYIHFL